VTTYIRPGTTETITLTTAMTSWPSTSFKITVQGGDCVVSSISWLVGSLTFDVTAGEDAVEGLRDVKISYSDKNAIPVVRVDEIEILKVGCLGSRLHFHVPLSVEFPDGMPLDDRLAPEKQFVVFALSGTSFNMPRIYMWDFGDRGSTALYPTATEPRWDATDGTTAPDINETVPKGRECALPGGYLSGGPEKWISEVAQWVPTGLNAYACAPDEFIRHSGVTVNEQKWTGFPDPTTPIESMTDIPRHSFFRKPHYYMSTPDYFWSRSKLSHATKNQAWNGGYGSGSQCRFVGLPLWYRGYKTGGGQTFDTNYGKPFKRMRELEQGPVGGTVIAYNGLSALNEGDLGVNAVAKGIMMLSIEPIECVLPGPQTNFPNVSGTDYKQKASYKRRENNNPSRGKSTMKAKIKLLYQDLFAFSDYYDGSPPATVTAGAHVMSDPIVIAEAYCPRIDIKWDYEEWNTRLQPTPNNVGLSEDYKYPKITMESQKFEWKLLLEQGDQVELGDSSNVITTGKYLDQPSGNLDNVVKAAELFIKEFDGYACKFVVDEAAWSASGVGDEDEQSFYSSVAGTPYATPGRDRQGTFIGVSGYIEVVPR